RGRQQFSKLQGNRNRAAPVILHHHASVDRAGEAVVLISVEVEGFVILDRNPLHQNRGGHIFAAVLVGDLLFKRGAGCVGQLLKVFKGCHSWSPQLGGRRGTTARNAR